jgi:hypothetical protein
MRCWRHVLYRMLANGIGARQLATRIALYSEANEARSAEVVPGTPLGSDAPGAPAVEPPMADGQAGAAGGGGVGACVGGVTGAAGFSSAAGVVVNVRTVVLAPASVELTDFGVVETAALDEVAFDEVDGLLDGVDVDGVAVATDVAVNTCADAASEVLDARESANVRPAACGSVGVTDDPAPWTRRTAATSAVATNTAFFNVCTPIQRLHCPPN